MPCASSVRMICSRIAVRPWGISSSARTVEQFDDLRRPLQQVRRLIHPKALGLPAFAPRISLIFAPVLAYFTSYRTVLREAMSRSACLQAILRSCCLPWSVRTPPAPSPDIGPTLARSFSGAQQGARCGFRSTPRLSPGSWTTKSKGTDLDHQTAAVRHCLCPSHARPAGADGRTHRGSCDAARDTATGQSTKAGSRAHPLVAHENPGCLPRHPHRAAGFGAHQRRLRRAVPQL